MGVVDTRDQSAAERNSKAIAPNGKHRGSGIPAMARRASQLLNQIEQTSRSDLEQVAKDHERVRVLASTATGGGIEKLMRVSPALTEEDRQFLRDLGWRV